MHMHGNVGRIIIAKGMPACGAESSLDTFWCDQFELEEH